MSLVDLIAIAFWPVILAILWRAWRLRADPASYAVPLCAAAILVGAAVIVTLVFDIVSLWVLFDIYAGMVLFGGLCLFALYARWAAFSVWKHIFIGLFSLALIGVGAAVLAADHVMPRQIIDGSIDRLFIHHTALGPNEYNVSIGGRLLQGDDAALRDAPGRGARARRDRPRIGIYLPAGAKGRAVEHSIHGHVFQTSLPRGNEDDVLTQR